MRELNEMELEQVAGGEQININATGQTAITDASGHAGNGAANVLNAAAGGLAVATNSNRTRQTNIALASIVF